MSRCSTSATLERLESRQLMSMTLTTVGGQVDFTLIQDAGAFTTLVNNSTGARYLLPQVKSDGSVSLVGTSNADQIVVEQVGGTITDSDPNVTHFVYLDNPDTARNFAVIPGLPDINKLTAMVEREQGILAQRQARLAELQSTSADQSAIDLQNETIDVSQRIIATGQRIIDRLNGGTSFTRYSLAGAYEFYVEMGEHTTTQARIRIDAGGGADTVSIANNVRLKTSVSGGPGADKLTSGSKRTNLTGGGGNDRLFSRSRSGGTLDGGPGADRYYNRYGDVLILARKDGDSIMVNGAPMTVSQPGIFGLPSTPSGKTYFMTQSTSGQMKDLLA